MSFLSPGNPRLRKIILLVAGIAVILLFSCLPSNKTWLKERIFGYWNDFQAQKKQMVPEQRMATRFTAQYTYSKYIADFFEKKGNKKNALVLIPPAAYFEKHGLNYPVPYPAVFYYYTGLRTIWANSPHATDANWYVSVRKQEIIIDSVTGKTMLNDTIAALKKYGLYE